jgi:hypothetical protein
MAIKDPDSEREEGAEWAAARDRNERLPPTPAESLYKDPFTGTTPVGPVQSETLGAPPPKDRWSMAAKWFLLALVLLVVVLIAGYFIW